VQLLVSHLQQENIPRATLTGTDSPEIRLQRLLRFRKSDPLFTRP
jgi:hypothetical protein